MDPQHQEVLCFRIVAEFLPTPDACRLISLNRFFSQHFSFEQTAAARLASSLPDGMVLTREVTFQTLLWMHKGFKNLLKNECGGAKYESWEKSDGGDGWTIEDWPEYKGKKKSVFVSSYDWCTLAQTVRLSAAGFTPAELQNAVVVAGAVICCRFDCGGTGQVSVSVDGEPLTTTGPVDCPETELCGMSFKPITISVIKKLPKNSENVRLEIRGKDRKFWAGYFGARFLHTFLYIVPFPEDVRADEAIKVQESGGLEAV